MSVNAAQVKAFAEEFEKLGNAKIELFIGYAKLSVPTKVWGIQSEFAMILLTCHLLKLAQLSSFSGKSGKSGPVVSETVGSLSKTYGPWSFNTSSLKPSSLTQTVYGAEFLRLQGSKLVTPLMVVA